MPWGIQASGDLVTSRECRRPFALRARADEVLKDSVKMNEI
jgi:hypothetical protein